MAGPAAARRGAGRGLAAPTMVPVRCFRWRWRSSARRSRALRAGGRSPGGRSPGGGGRRCRVRARVARAPRRGGRRRVVHGAHARARARARGRGVCRLRGRRVARAALLLGRGPSRVWAASASWPWPSRSYRAPSPSASCTSCPSRRCSAGSRWSARAPRPGPPRPRCGRPPSCSPRGGGAWPRRCRSSRRRWPIPRPSPSSRGARARPAGHPQGGPARPLVPGAPRAPHRGGRARPRDRDVATLAATLTSGGCADVGAAGFRTVVARREGALREMAPLRACLGRAVLGRRGRRGVASAVGQGGRPARTRPPRRRRGDPGERRGCPGVPGSSNAPPDCQVPRCRTAAPAPARQSARGIRSSSWGSASPEASAAFRVVGRSPRSRPSPWSRATVACSSVSHARWRAGVVAQIAARGRRRARRAQVCAGRVALGHLAPRHRGAAQVQLDRPDGAGAREGGGGAVHPGAERAHLAGHAIARADEARAVGVVCPSGRGAATGPSPGPRRPAGSRWRRRPARARPGGPPRRPRGPGGHGGGVAEKRRGGGGPRDEPEEHHARLGAERGGRDGEGVEGRRERRESYRAAQEQQEHR